MTEKFYSVLPINQYYPIQACDIAVLEKIIGILKGDKLKFLEIGAGISTGILLQYGEVVSIDISKERNPNKGNQFIWGDSYSPEIPPLLEDKNFDLLFIDGDHRYYYVLHDIKSYLPKVKNGGIICGHDFEDYEFDIRQINRDSWRGKHHGVIKAVTENFPNVKKDGNIWWTSL